MNKMILTMALGGLFALAAGPASAAVNVTFLHPEQFSDMPWNAREREDVLKALTEHFNKLGATLPAGENLKIEVLDLDLAGRLRHLRNGQDIRVLNGGADWPHMRLRYTVERDGQVLSSGEDELSNMMYLDRFNRYADGDPLRYEKQMLDEWFKGKFAANRVANAASN